MFAFLVASDRLCNVLLVARLLFEMPVIGSVMPSAEFSTAKLLRYIDTLGELVLAFEVICGLFVLYYIVEEILEVSQCASSTSGNSTSGNTSEHDAISESWSYSI